MVKLSATVHAIVLFAILCWSPLGVTGQRMAKQVPVTDLDGLYQALLSKSTHIVVNGNIEADETLKRKVGNIQTREAGAAEPQSSLPTGLVAFSFLGDDTSPAPDASDPRLSSKDAPIEPKVMEEVSYFPPVEQHSTRLVCGIPGGGRCMLAGSGRGMRAFLVRAGGNLYLEGFELRGWSAATGGAIRLDGGGKATLIDCTLEGNSASAGGATLNGAAPDSSTSFVDGAPWSLTSAGGAVFVADGAALEARDVEFVSNFAGEDGAGTPEGFGGAVAVLGAGSLLRCESCSFVKNAAGAAGGAVAAAAGGSVALSGPSGQLTGNTAHLAGGAVAVLGYGSRVEAADLSIWGNTAEKGPGGALALDRLEPTEGPPIASTSRPLLLATNCSFLGNTAGSNGGSLSLRGFSSAYLEGCAVSEGLAAGNGGALSIYGSSQASLVSTNISLCSAKAGGAVALEGEYAVLELTAAVLKENRAQDHGGHISATGKSRVLVVDSSLLFGAAMNLGGGALYFEGEGTKFAGRGLLVKGNVANQGCGGALHVSGQAAAALVDSAMGDNSAQLAGAVCADAGGQVLLTGRSILDSNMATGTLDGLSIVVKNNSDIVVDEAWLISSTETPPHAAQMLLGGSSRAVLLAATFFNSPESDLRADEAPVDVLVDDTQDFRARIFTSEELGMAPVTIDFSDRSPRPLEECPPVSCTLPASAEPETLASTGQCPILPAVPVMFSNGTKLDSAPLLAEAFGCRPISQKAIVAELPLLEPVFRGAPCGPKPTPGQLCGLAGSASALLTLPCSDGLGPLCNPPIPSTDPWPPPPPTPLPPPPPTPPPPPPLTGMISKESVPSPPPAMPVLIPAPPALGIPDPAEVPNGGSGLLIPDPGSTTSDKTPTSEPKPPEPLAKPTGKNSNILIMGIAAAITGALGILAGTIIYTYRSSMRKRRNTDDSHDPEMSSWTPSSAMPSSLGFPSAAKPSYHTVNASSPHSSTATASPDGTRAAPPHLAPVTSGWRTVYQFLPCGKSDMHVDKSCATPTPHGTNSRLLMEVEGQPGVFIPRPLDGKLVRGPALPNFAPKGWGRTDVHMTLPARLFDAYFAASSSMTSLSSGDIWTSTGSLGSGRQPAKRRNSIPAALEILPFGPEDGPNAGLKSTKTTTKRGGEAGVVAHRTLKRTNVNLLGGAPAVERSESLKEDAAEAPPRDDGLSIVRGLSKADWNNSGLVEIDFEAEILPNLQEQIGSGAFGDVYLATWRGMEVAVKIFNRGFAGATGEQAESFRQEVLMMTRLGRGCRQIVSIYGACFRQPHMALVYQYIPGGDLYSRIHKKSNPPLTYLEILKVGRDLASGLSFLHPYVVHRDLKPMNILLDSDGTAMLIDFGVSRERDPKHSYFNTKAGGTPAYMAPEMFTGDKFSEKVDVYALACILCECLSRQPPWSDNTNFGIIVYTVSVKDERPSIPDSAPERLRRLISRCWDKDPRSRPSCYEIAQKLNALVQQEQARLDAETDRLGREQDEQLKSEVQATVQRSTSGSSQAAVPPNDEGSAASGKLGPTKACSPLRPQRQDEPESTATPASATQVWAQLQQQQRGESNNTGAAQPVPTKQAEAPPASATQVWRQLQQMQPSNPKEEVVQERHQPQ